MTHGHYLYFLLDRRQMSLCCFVIHCKMSSTHHYHHSLRSHPPPLSSAPVRKINRPPPDARTMVRAIRAWSQDTQPSSISALFTHCRFSPAPHPQPTHSFRCGVLLTRCIQGYANHNRVKGGSSFHVTQEK